MTAIYDFSTKTAWNAISALREAVQSKPSGYRYRDDHSQCVYATADECACIVGHVLHSWGVPTAKLYHINGTVFSLKDHDISLSPGVLAVLGAAQAAQDMEWDANGESPTRSLTWSEVVRIAEMVARALTSQYLHDSF